VGSVAEAAPVRGRYAPSPTGRIHLGNARTALAAWLSARRQGGSFVWRVEDLDGPRTVPGLAAVQMEDLAWLGLDWDEGPDRGGPFAPYLQSERTELYEAALARLAEAGRLFPCRRSRKDLQGLASAPHGPEGLPYPAAFRPLDLPPDWYALYSIGSDRSHPSASGPASMAPASMGSTSMGSTSMGSPALRFRVDSEAVRFVDQVFGPLAERVDLTVGDFVLKRRDGLFAYQLAVVVDDLAMGITEVVRGADLLASTARQIQLIAAFGGHAPVYAHVPLVVGPQGEKLSKRDEAQTLRSLREAGVAAERVAGLLGASLGLVEWGEECAPRDLIPRFRWDLVPREEWRIPSPLFPNRP
jgi:glutamyl-tRNA synthetase